MYVTSDEEGERNEQRNKDEQKQAKLEWDVRKHHHQVDLIPMEKDKGQKEEKQSSTEREGLQLEGRWREIRNEEEQENTPERGQEGEEEDRYGTQKYVQRIHRHIPHRHTSDEEREPRKIRNEDGNERKERKLKTQHISHIRG